MIPWLALTPEPPGWLIDWAAVEEVFPDVPSLAACQQDPEYHGEGDVWTHTRMACEALAANPSYRQQGPDERALLFTTVLLHDAAKPSCTRLDLDGRITSRGHARRGSIRARDLLWRLDAPFIFREQVAALIRHHQVPFHLMADPDPIRKVITVSQTARCDLLTLVAEADALGRICRDQDTLLESVMLFAEQCRELGCFDRPYPFRSDHSRFLYFRRRDRDPAYEALDDTRLEVVLLSGLPGAGKDRWLTQNLTDWPVTSLDQIRHELGVDPEDDQGAVVNEARERARVYLRRREPFAWNATNLSRDMRSRGIDLCADYGAKIRLVYVEAPAARLFDQNADRAHAVPARAIERLLGRWEVPDLTEAHEVQLAVTESATGTPLRAWPS
jgi:predicted kinase